MTAALGKDFKVARGNLTLAPMRHTLPLLSLAAAANATTFTYTANFDGNGFSDGTRVPTAPFVGQATLSFTAASPLADGNYAWNSFSNLSFNVTLNLTNSATISYTEADLDVSWTPAADIHVQLKNGAFYFTNNLPDGYTASSAFTKDGYLFSTQGIQNDSVPFGGTTPTLAPMFTVNDMANDGDNVLFGVYGGGAPVPEPSTYGLALGGLAFAGVALRRRARK